MESRGPTTTHGMMKNATLPSPLTRSKLAFALWPLEARRSKLWNRSALNSDLLEIIKVSNNNKYLEFSQR